MKSKPVNRIRILQSAVVDHRIYGVSRNLLNWFLKDGFVFWQVVDRSTAGKYEKENGLTLAAFDAAILVMQIPGVNYVLIKRDHIDVCKSCAYDWEELQPAILSAIRSTVFQADFDEVVVDDTIAKSAAAQTALKPARVPPARS